ncbi:hypothetical protein Taro_010606 [Colocasia esculenta]|uniref:Uncharacterized protein n=1 Tax=Colocasia esculenta TaxID=4460 RepID=A0A843UA37_COLES|nr:hypothetical protein [Colocasia esculenta]
MGSECELQESVAAIAGCACFERGCCFARAAVDIVFGLRIRVGVSQRLREPTGGVAFTGAGLLHVDLGGGFPVALVGPRVSLGSGGLLHFSRPVGFSRWWSGRRAALDLCSCFISVRLPTS